MGHPRPLFRLFSAFFSQTSIEFYNKLMWKYVYQVYGVGIRTQSSGHESLPITTRPLFFFCLPRYVATFLDRSLLYQLYFLVSKQNRCRDTRHIVKNLFIKFANDCATCLSFFLFLRRENFFDKIQSKTFNHNSVNFWNNWFRKF